MKNFQNPGQIEANNRASPFISATSSNAAICPHKIPPKFSSKHIKSIYELGSQQQSVDECENKESKK